mgnify:CR=1 FL=1
MRTIRAVLAVVLLSVLAACAATGPLHKEVAASIPPVPAGKGRVYFYRADTMFGAAVTSDIKLNNRVVGRSERGSFFYVDENPGKCLVSTSTELEKQLTFTLGAGETRYVRTSVSLGLLVGRINAELVNNETAKSEIVELHYTGVALK